MPIPLNGFGPSSANRLLFGPGAVRINYGIAGERLLGATRGGSEFNPGVKQREIQGDFPYGNLKGFRVLDEVMPSLTVNLMEISKANLLIAIPGLRETTVGAYAILKPDDIISTDYITNIALLATISGSAEPVICIVKNALANGEISLKLDNKSEAVLSITFNGHFDPAALTDYPFEWRFPTSAT